MSELDIQFDTKEDLAAAIFGAENSFSDQITRAAAQICSEDSLKAICLAGPSCSGKTTAAALLSDELRRRGRHVVTVSIDDFYRDFGREDGGSVDFESFSALDSDALAKAAKAIRATGPVLIPVFDFVSRRRRSFRRVVPRPDTVFLFEGIQALYPEFSAFFPDARRIFISVAEDARINGVFFDKSELRLLRRLLRDKLYRDSSADFTLTLWRSVRENEEQNILPREAECDIRIDSYLCYETPILCRALMPITAAVSPESANFAAAGILTEKMSRLVALAVDESFIPEGSVLREFTAVG